MPKSKARLFCCSLVLLISQRLPNKRLVRDLGDVDSSTKFGCRSRWVLQARKAWSLASSSRAKFKKDNRMSKNKRRQAKHKQSNNRIVQFSIVALVAIGIIAGIIFLPSLQADTSQVQTAPISQVNGSQVSQVEPVANKTSSNAYSELASPEDWTEDTPVQIYNGLNSTWEDKTYRDVGPGMEFIFEGYVYATTPEKGFLFAKPELDITKLAETDQSFDPDNWRMPKPDDIVKVFRSDDPYQQKGHWLLKDVQPDSEVIFQGKVWSWELDLANQRFVIKDTGNVFAKVTAVHEQVHQGDVLALTVRYEACGKLGLITGSEEHPFYVLDKEDYIPMVGLESGMELKTDTGARVTVVELKPLPDEMELYNLTVEHVNNYYIFPSEDEAGVLVHNTGPCDLVSVAENYADNIAKSATSRGSRPSTVAVLSTSDGRMFYGTSGHGMDPSEALLDILNQHPFNFGCAEVSCLNQAINAGQSLQGASITTLKIRGPLDNPIYEFQPPCRGGCDTLLSKLGVNVVGGP